MMNVLVCLSSNILSEGICNLLVKNGHKAAVAGHNEAVSEGFAPDVILVDIASAGRRSLTSHPGAKVLLVDTGVEKEKIINTLCAYQLHGVLSVDTELPLFDKALHVVADGQIWVDNNTLKVFLREGAAPTAAQRVGNVTEREKEIIELVCRGWSNREIAAHLSLSEHTIKAHLNRIFRKCNASSRSKLITLMMRQGRETTA
jgi:DNA-binding NarL/FixJ family response regulator